MLFYTLGNFASSKRDPYTLMGAMQGEMLADDEYPLKFNFIQRQKYYKEIKEKLDSDPDSVIEQMHYLRRMVLTPENAFVYLAGHKERLVRLKMGKVL